MDTAQSHVDDTIQDSVGVTENVTPTAAEGTTAMSPGMIWATAAVVSALVTVISLVVYHMAFAPKVLRFGSIDLAAVMDIKHLELSARAVRPGVTDKDRAAIYDSISGFGNEIEKALTDMSRECDCTLLVRQAVVHTGIADYTDTLKRRLKIDSLNVVALQAEISGKPLTTATLAPPTKGIPGLDRAANELTSGKIN